MRMKMTGRVCLIRLGLVRSGRTEPNLCGPAKLCEELVALLDVAEAERRGGYVALRSHRDKYTNLFYRNKNYLRVLQTLREPKATRFFSPQNCNPQGFRVEACGGTRRAGLRWAAGFGSRSFEELQLFVECSA